MSRVAITETVLQATSPATFARSAEVYVYQRGTTTKATLYTTESGGTTISQPLTTDSGGRPESGGGVTPWIATGSYDLKINGQTVPWEAADGEAASASETVKTVAASGTAQTINLTEGTVWDITLTGDCTLTLPTPEKGRTFTLRLVQDGTGSRLVSWPANTRWSGGVLPVLSTAKESVDVVSFSCIDGEHWLGFFDGKGMVVGGGSETVPPAVQTGLNEKTQGVGYPGLIVPPPGVPMSTSTLVPATNAAYYVRFVAPYTGFVCKSVNVITTVAATKNDLCAVALFAADGETILANSGSVAGKMNATAGTQNIPFASKYEGTVGGTVYYLAFQYQIVEAGTAATLSSAALNNSKIVQILNGSAGNILFSQPASPPTFPFATTPSIANQNTNTVPLMYLRST